MKVSISVLAIFISGSLIVPEAKAVSVVFLTGLSMLAVKATETHEKARDEAQLQVLRTDGAAFISDSNAKPSSLLQSYFEANHIEGAEAQNKKVRELLGNSVSVK